jgi:hypothetical protein
MDFIRGRERFILVRKPVPASAKTADIGADMRADMGRVVR